MAPIQSGSTHLLPFHLKLTSPSEGQMLPDANRNKLPDRHHDK